MKVYFKLNKQTAQFKPQIKQLFSFAIKQTQKPDNICVNVCLVSDKKIKQLNNEYRNVNKVTDVLSFPMIDDFCNICNEPDFFTGECNIGDIYINLNRAQEQAKEYGHSLKREFCFLALHGFLHLLGYDHITKQQEKEMFGIANNILQIANIQRD